MKKTRVLVVEDSVTIRQYLLGVLARDENMEVVGEASDGKQAIELCQALRPDVVTMDIMLPVMTGTAASEYIMAYCPTPILIVSASVNLGEALHTYDALAAGAVDVLDKPKEGESREAWEARFVSAVRIVSRVKVITHNRARTRQPLFSPRKPEPQETLPAAAIPSDGVRLIAIGASTGGPAAVADVLRALPRDFPIPILILIHISEQFAGSLVDWMNTVSHIPVRFAVDGEPVPEVGTPAVIFAPAGRHLVIRGGHLCLTDDAERHSCRPSVDVLFESLAREAKSQAVFCLLTGMGRDGAKGLLAARKAGALTIAQDEASSVIFGMPGEAVKLHAAVRILPLEQISASLLQLTREASAGKPKAGASRG